MRIRPIKRNFYQKQLFLRWAAHNHQLFSHPPYLLRQEKGSFVIGFRGVSRHITCTFTNNGMIMIGVDYRNVCFDIVWEFDLYEEQTSSGSWLCSMCRDHPNPDKTEPLIEYEDREKLWIGHSFEPLAEWTRETFTREARLYLYRSRGCTSAEITQRRNLKKAMKQSEFFKMLPVLTAK